MKKILFFAVAVAAVALVACSDDDLSSVLDDLDTSGGSTSGCTCTLSTGGSMTYSESQLSGMSCSEFASYMNSMQSSYTMTCN